MNQLFDIACNFTHEAFANDLDEVINSAVNAGVNKFLVVSAELTDQPSINKIVKMVYFRIVYNICMFSLRNI